MSRRPKRLANQTQWRYCHYNRILTLLQIESSSTDTMLIDIPPSPEKAISPKPKVMTPPASQVYSHSSHANVTIRRESLIIMKRLLPKRQKDSLIHFLSDFRERTRKRQRSKHQRQSIREKKES